MTYTVSGGALNSTQSNPMAIPPWIGSMTACDNYLPPLEHWENAKLKCSEISTLENREIMML